jgi:hypothetical protein
MAFSPAIDNNQANRLCARLKSSFKPQDAKAARGGSCIERKLGENDIEATIRIDGSIFRLSVSPASLGLVNPSSASDRVSGPTCYRAGVRTTCGFRMVGLSVSCRPAADKSITTIYRAR